MAKRQLTEFGTWVKKKLIDNQMSQTELANKIGTSKQYLNLILHGERTGDKYINVIKNVLIQEERRCG